MSAIFLPNQLSSGRLQVRVAWGADLTADEGTWFWTDISSDVMMDNVGGISLVLGRGNEASVAQPATCTFRLKNQTGSYTPGSPGSSNYPNVRLGTPISVRVSLNGGINATTRFQGEASSWSPAWDAQGRFAYVTVTASGITRRLGSGSKPLKSALYRALTGVGTLAPIGGSFNILPLAYWPLEDGPQATQASTPVIGGYPMTVTGDLAFGATTGAPGSDVQPDFSRGGQLNGLVKVDTDPPAPPVPWRIQFVAKINALGVGDFVVPVQWITADGNAWEVDITALADGGVTFSTDAGGVVTTTSGVAADDQLWHEFRVTASQSGGNIAVLVFVDGVQVISTSVPATTISRIVSVQVNPASSSSTFLGGVGHIAVWGTTVHPADLDSVGAMNGYAGELATARIARLCEEEIVPVTMGVADGPPMGAQGIDTFLNLLRECEAADLGFLLDGLSAGLQYVPRAALYNISAQVTIDANSGQVPAIPGPLPTLDDQRIINRVTVTNKNGSFAVDEDTDGPQGTDAIGVFDARYLVNVYQDAQLLNIGSWLIHLRTPDGMRYPQIVLDLTAAPELAATWIGAIPANRFDVTNLSNRLTQHPSGDVSLLAEGWSEVLNTRVWRVSANCSPFQPWRVPSLDSSFRLEMAGQTLNSNLVAGATSLSLATAAGHQLFTTLAADFPLDLNVSGWKIHVTNASGSSSPQTLTITASPNTSTITSGTAVKLWQPAALAL